jgi:SpoVK/Ycf46/Vps4 family AAA+-type ATPase
MSNRTARELALLIRSGWRLVALESFEEERALHVIRRAARSIERRALVWSLTSGVDGTGAGAGELAAGLRELGALREPALLVVLDAHRLVDERLAARALRDLLPAAGERAQAVVLLGPGLALPSELERECARLELPLPRARELDAIFRQALESPDAEQLAACVRAALGLSAAEALRVFRKACSITGGLTPETASLIAQEKRAALRRTPALSFHEPGAGLSQVGGLGELKRWLRERRRAFSDEARQFGLPVPRGLLLLGVQGCGKSLSAKAVAAEWQFPLLRLDLAAAFGAGGRSPEATIREAMAVAESIAPAVLWIDEIEKGFASSDTSGSASRVFGSFLTWLAEKQSPVFVVATANDVARLPPELLRRGRFDELFFVDLPTQAERMEILAIHLQRRGRDPLQLDLEGLAAQAERLSGAELEQVVSAALYTAFTHGRDVEFNDLANAINETVPLYETYEERIKELRDWARTRARPATLDARMANLFS